jgi:hypothetical protein
MKKFFKSKIVTVGGGCAIAFVMLSAFASTPSQPVVQINQYVECVKLLVVKDGQEVSQPCPNDWENYKRVYVRTQT